jgi:4-diphosphocytidyl-2-C-methyl-D-erythritol kinase
MAAHAKLNLGLSVLGRRPDGFHDIDTTMLAIDLHDDVSVWVEGDSDRLVRRRSGDAWLDAADLPLDHGNLILRALGLYRRAVAAAGGAAVPPLRIALCKRIPLAAGLGGGSSDAAAALRLFETGWPAAVDLASLAAEIGSDVPFFLTRCGRARALGRGERLKRLPDEPVIAVAVNPCVAVSAADAYRWWSAAEAEARRPAPRGRPDLTNDLEAGVAGHVPAVAELLAWLRAATTSPVAMSGSGATCYALLEDEDAAEGLASRARRDGRWWVRVVRSAQPGGAGSDGAPSGPRRA